eukprot:Em0005g206a
MRVVVVVCISLVNKNWKLSQPLPAWNYVPTTSNTQCQSCNRYEELVAQIQRDKVELIEINMKLNQHNDMLVQDNNSLQTELNTLKKESKALKEHCEEMEAKLADINVKLDQSNDDLIGRTNRLHYELAALNKSWQRAFEEYSKSMAAAIKNSTEPLEAHLAKTELEGKQSKKALEQSRKENTILADVKPPQSNNDLIGNRNSKLDSPNERLQLGFEEHPKSIEAALKNSTEPLKPQLAETELEVKPPKEPLEQSRISGLSDASKGQEAAGPRSKDQTSVLSNRKFVQGICGLSNLGGSCYMNAALQCLNSAVLFREHFLQECTAAGGAGVLGSYRELMDAMWRGDKRILKPDRLAVSCYAVEYRDIEYRDIEYRDIEYRDIEYMDIEYRDIEYRDIEYRDIEYRDIEYMDIEYRDIEYRDIEYRDIEYRDIEYRDIEYRDIEYMDIEVQGHLEYRDMEYRDIEYMDIEYRDIEYRDIEYRDIEYRDIEYMDIEYRDI